MAYNNFSVVSLFKVNLLPSSDPSKPPLSQNDLERVKKLCQLEVCEPEHDNIERLVEREKAFVEHYQNDIAP